MPRKLLLVVLTVAGIAAFTLPGALGAGPAGLSYTGSTTAVTGNQLTLTATLNDASGTARPGVDVTFTLANQAPVTATTDGSGVATAAVRVLKAAGTYDLTIAGGGETTKVPLTVAAPATSTSIVKAGAGGGEPSIAIGPEGNIYVSSPGNPIMAKSTNGGQTWKQPNAKPFTTSNDTSLATDASGAVYITNLTLINGANSGQTDLYKSTNIATKDSGITWQRGIGFAGNGMSASGNAFASDREWNDSYIPPGKTTDQALVYMAYHDLGPYDGMWLVTSKDGGRTFGVPTPIATSPTGAADSFCNTIPGGLKVVQDGPHAGRVYVVWLAGDPVTNPATGCNYTQMDTFHTVWIAWSDDTATATVPTWTNQLVYDGGIGHDASTLFADLTLDNQGNPYITTSVNAGSSPVQQGEFDTFVWASFDGGRTWNGKTDGTGTPYKVNLDTGSHVFATIAAGDPGQVSVAYLRTPNLVPTLPYGKPKPGGDPNAEWKLYLAQSLDLNLGTPTWTVTEATPDPMHKGDICTLGIFCIPTVSDRSILDFIDIAVDRNGMAHIAYADNFGNSIETDVVNQTGGASVGAGGR